MASVTNEFNITKAGVLKGYKGKSPDVLIPDGVKKIGSMAFIANSRIQSVTIPGSVTEIGESAFYNCDSLKSVVIQPGKLVTICDGAFGDCKKLTILELPETVKNISDSAFRGCDGLADESGCLVFGDTLNAYVGTSKDVAIRDGIKTIASEAFKWNDTVETITIPDGVKTIGASAFRGCENLKKVTISDGVETIGEYAFCGCANLKEINIPESICEIGDCAFSNCPQLADENGFFIIGNSLFSFCGNKADVVIPEGISKIEPWAFGSNQTVAKVTIPDSVTEIGHNAFYQCGQLSDISLPKGLKKISNSVFGGCLSLPKVIIPETVTEIGNRAFYNCTFESITIPEAVIIIGDSAFMSCEKLTSIALPKNLEELGDGAFKLCKSLETLYIPRGVRAIGPNTFSGCWNLKKIEAPEHLHKDIDNCYLTIDVQYYSGIDFDSSSFSENEMVYDEDEAINKVIIKCKPEDFTAIQKLFEESLARYYMTGACFHTVLFEKILAEIREDEALCKVYTADDALCAEIADGVEAGELLAWKLLNKNSFRNEFGSIACVGEAVLQEFPYVDFSVLYQMQDISESTEKVWTEDGKIESEWLED